jgi:threonine-phosphate decarboxylase
MIGGHGGNIYELARNMGCEPDQIIDMSSNINPLGPVPGLLGHLEQDLKTVHSLPEVDSRELVEAFARHYDIPIDRVLAGNGTTQFIFSMPSALRIKRALILGPTYADYADACLIHKTDLKYSLAKETNRFQPDMKDIETCIKDVDAVFICNPNNPTGHLIERKDLLKLCESNPTVDFIIDESYLPFMRKYEDTTMIHEDVDNVIVLHSFSKIFCVPGLRLGFLVAPPQKAALLKKRCQPWSVNSLAQTSGLYLLGHFASSDDFFLRRTWDFVAREHQLLAERLRGIDALRLFPSMTSFVLIKIEEGFDAPQVCANLARNRILVRNCSNFKGLSNQFFRISLKRSEINLMVAEKLSEMFAC